MPFHVAAWEDALGRYGISAGSAELYELEGIPTADVVDLLAERHNPGLSAAARAEITSRKRRRYAEIFVPRPLPGARQLVELLDRLGYRLSLVTGTVRSSGEQALDQLGVRDLFAVIVSADDVSAGKPAPEPYLRALRALGVAPANCLVIENAPPGIAAAHAAGLRCVVVATYLPAATLRALPGAYATFDTIAGLTEWIRDEAARSGAQGSFLLSSMAASES
jgi:HAD superfamily hydrolase (TIGR01509 family)